MTLAKDPLCTRRRLLGLSWRALVGAGLLSRAPEAGLAASGSGALHRALVCIYLFGGNDSNNLIVRLEPEFYQGYARLRGASALPKQVLLPVSASFGTQYGLHPALADLRDLYNARVLAVVAGVGDPEQNSQPYAALRLLPGGFAVPAWAADHAGVAGFEGIGVYTFKSGFSLVSPGSSIVDGSQFENDTLRRAIEEAGPLATRFPDTGLGRQFAEVALLLAAAPRIRMSQQVFLCPLGGFGAASGQDGRQAMLFGELSEAMTAFYEATVELGIAGRVTTFTDSEYNRALRPNAREALDAGWAGHQLVMGGAVLGGEVYGEFPRFTERTAAADITRGVFAPAVSSSQYAATLAAWFGIRLSDLPQLFPGFDGSTLGFLT